MFHTYRHTKSQNLFIRSSVPMQIVFHRTSSSIECSLPLNVVFHKRLSSIKCRLPSKFVFCQWSSSFSYAQTHRHTDAHTLHYNIDCGILTKKNGITHMCLCFLKFFHLFTDSCWGRTYSILSVMISILLICLDISLRLITKMGLSTHPTTHYKLFEGF